MKQENSESPQAASRLGLFDTVSIIVGIVVGTAIFKLPQLVFGNTPTIGMGFLAWIVGGLLALVGAMCYAELATVYRASGGDYVYLTRAYGPLLGFLFAWAHLAMIITGSIGAMAYAFADYTEQLIAFPASAKVWVALAPVVGLTAINLIGVKMGKSAQNALTVIKAIGLSGIVLVGAIAVAIPGEPAAVDAAGDTQTGDSSQTDAAPAGEVDESGEVETQTDIDWAKMGLALVFVMYAYGGWNDAAFVASEVRDQSRDLPRALILGVAAITGIYLLVNAAYVGVLGLEGVRSSGAPAADVMQRVIGPIGSKLISLLVMISAMGAINGLIFTGSRVYASLGRDHRLFAKLDEWSDAGAPTWSLLSQGLVAVILVFAVGTDAGRGWIDGSLQAFGLSAVPWAQYFGGFDTLVAASAPVFWGFFLLSGIGFFILRYKDADMPRPYRVPLYPLTPLIFCATSVYMLYHCTAYAGVLTLLGFVPVIVGVPLYWISRQLSPAGPPSPLK